jgi:hypothetical protein
MKFYCLLTSLLFSFLVNAQTITRKLADHQTGAGVPFATIKILQTEKGTIASASGEFQLDISETDSVLITSVGYDKRIIVGNDIAPVIYMDAKAISLKPVSIKALKPQRSFVLGNGAPFLNEKISCDFNPKVYDNPCYPWGGENIEFAERMALPDSSSIYKLKNVIIPLRTKFTGCWEFLLHVYEEDSITHFPGEEVFMKSCHFTRRDLHRAKVIIDLSGDNILFQQGKAFFVSVGLNTDNGKGGCHTVVLLKISDYHNTYSRGLKNMKFEWIPFGQMTTYNGSPQQIATLFAAEVEQMK